jgi:anti-sigma regulatory factor (Ser/Thr protein kinase)
MDASYAVQLIVPAEPGSARLARLVAAALAADADFTIDETEDLRVAVSELVALLVEGDEAEAGDLDDRVTLSYQRKADSVEISGARALRAGRAEVVDGSTPDDLALEILRVVVDEHHYEHDGNGRHFRLLKRARADV